VERVAKAGPLILLWEDTAEGEVLNFIVLSGARVQQVFSLKERHLIGRPEAIELLAVFIERLKEKEERLENPKAFPDFRAIKRSAKDGLE